MNLDSPIATVADAMLIKTEMPTLSPSSYLHNMEMFKTQTCSIHTAVLTAGS